VGEISIMATHGTFSGDRWRELPAAGAQRIVVTDSVPDVRSRAGQMVEVLSVTPLVIEALDQLASRGTPRTGP
jgi:ribose-phosphate pyrophosphokinase